MTCAGCGRGPLTRDECGLTRKLLSRDARDCFCLCCLSRRFRVPEEQLREMAEAFRRNGCLLFR